MLRTSFEREMDYLHAAGKEFAREFPELGRALDIDSVQDRDPYVERLFEGFAFLTARIHERLDRAMNEGARRLAGQVWPSLTSPFPSVVIVECEVEEGALSASKRLERGERLEASGLSKNERVIFTTGMPVTLNPVRVDRVSTTERSLTVDLRIDAGAQPSSVDWEDLSFYLHGSQADVSRMLHLLVRSLDRMEVRCGDFSTSVPGSDALSQVGFGEDEGLIPDQDTVPGGHRILFEFLNCRRRFHFVRLNQMDALAQASARQIAVSFHFDRDGINDLNPDESNLRLHCVPAVNLFRQDAEPISFAGHKSGYPVRTAQAGLAVHRVIRLAATDNTSGESKPIHPFTALGVSSERSEEAERFDFDTTTGSLRLSNLTTAGRVTLSPECLCSNGNDPYERLPSHAPLRSDRLGSSVPLRTLTRPTPYLLPPGLEREDYLWEVIRTWSSNFTAADPKLALVTLLRLYDWSPTQMGSRFADSVVDVSAEPFRFGVRGGLRTGVRMIVTLSSDRLAEDLPVSEFGEALFRFYQVESVVNQSAALRIQTSANGTLFEWDPNPA